MMTSNQAMLKAVTPSHSAEPPVLIDWLPWSHTFGGNNNFNLVLANGGSYYIDQGKPLPGAIEATVQNLREVSPTVYYNVPRGFEMLLPYLQADEQLRRSLYFRLQSFCYAGAALAPHIREEFEELGLATVGEVVPMLTSFGSTETGPSALSTTDRARQPGVIGVPNPGVEIKLVPNTGKLEARVRSPSVTPGYWRQPALTKAAFDEEGYYQFGDALRFADESDPELGFVFDGRVAEDFKLATGTWVSVGPLRLRFIAHCAPHVTDVIVAGHDRDDATALIVPNLATCRELSGLGDVASAAEVLAVRARTDEVRGPARRVQQSRRRQFGTARAHHPDGRSALARHRGADRQGFDQPARRAFASRRDGRGALRRNAVGADDPVAALADRGRGQRARLQKAQGSPAA